MRRNDHAGQRLSVKFPGPVLDELLRESARLDRPISWLIARAWKASRGEIRELPAPRQIKDAAE